jgi:hypothetical protein
MSAGIEVTISLPFLACCVALLAGRFYGFGGALAGNVRFGGIFSGSVRAGNKPDQQEATMNINVETKGHRASRGIAVGLAVISLSSWMGLERAHAALPPGNSVEQWNKIAENTVVGSGAFQNEGLIYMAYVSGAVYDATVAINGGYRWLGAPIDAPHGASTDAAVIEASYDTLVHYFPAQAATLYPLYTEALGLIPNGTAKSNGQQVGLAAANNFIALRNGDGRLTPIGVTSTFPTKTPGPGVWRLTPAAYAPPQTPWVGNVKPFVLKSAAQFLPDPPPSLQSTEWVDAFAGIQEFGSAASTVRTAEQTAIAKFWTANVIRQYNQAARDIADARHLNLLKTARLAAMVNVIGADAQISVMYAKYHYLFWRPVTAIDPTSVSATGDGFGPIPGFDDGNTATVEMAGWRPLVATPNHPEYPAAHGSLTSAMAEVFSAFMDDEEINVDIHGFDAAGAAGNLDAVQHFKRSSDLRRQIVDARYWAGLHYRFSGESGVTLGRRVANFDLAHAFGEKDD